MQYLIDTDFLISLHFSTESTHDKAVALAEKFLINQESSYSDLVLMECITVVSRKYSQRSAVTLAKKLRANPQGTLSVSDRQKSQTWELFEQQTAIGASLIDCSNVVLAKIYGCQIMSFDQFYQKFNVLALVH